ncbi:MAG: DNA polymerase III subunit tau [Lentisphaerae bacterium ADurb.Bin242]|nr:MAG: DNA polymerase III subunit tau [Lentisphaerae bacterium ADurb.Bin242]
MAYQVTARKWRPQRFSDMVGQEHVARTLRNAIVTGRIAHAYLFVGPRGIGKTTSARIFAKALNCKHPIDGEPCCECSSCKAIADESSVDVIEIDAATHTQVEKARDICEDVLHLPISSKYKIYIIDEVHMLSKSAWNALLKTIEEPPAHAKFIFATTEVNKVLPTVISRCQRFDLSRIPSELIARRLAYIAAEEKINISRSALDVIARAADGGMRDAQSLLDQIVSFFGNNPANETISEAQALSLFGLTAPGEMESLLSSILANDCAAAILSVHQFAEQGKNLETLYEEILTWLRGVMLSLILPDPKTVLDESLERIQSYRALAAKTNAEVLQILLEQLSSSSYFLREAINKQVFMETILLRAMRHAHAVRIEDLLTRLNQIRKNGELEGIDKIPSLSQIPVASPPKGTGAESKTKMTEPVPGKNPSQSEMTEPAPARRPSESPAAPPIPPVAQHVPAATVPAEPLPKPSVTPEKTAPSEEKKPEPLPGQKVASVIPPEKTAHEMPGEESEAEEEEALEPEMEVPAEPEAEEEAPAPEKKESSIPLCERISPELLWEKLADSIRPSAYSIAELMKEGFPDRIENAALRVAFDDKLGVAARNTLEKERDFLLRHLRGVSGDSQADLVFFLKKKMHGEKAPKKKLEQLKQEAAQIPVVKETADLFDGMIVDVFE